MTRTPKSRGFLNLKTLEVYSVQLSFKIGWRCELVEVGERRGKVHRASKRDHSFRVRYLVNMFIEHVHNDNVSTDLG